MFLANIRATAAAPASSPTTPFTMEGAFTHVGNHLVSDSAAAIKAGADDISNLDPDDALLYGTGAGPSGRRRATDDDVGAYDDDDLDSNHTPVDPVTGLRIKSPQEEPLPPHACA